MQVSSSSTLERAVAHLFVWIDTGEHSLLTRQTVAFRLVGSSNCVVRFLADFIGLIQRRVLG